MQQTNTLTIDMHVNQLKKPFSLDVLSGFSLNEINNVVKFQITHPSYAPTPLVRLSALAGSLGFKEIFVKNEAERFGLNAFKVLGGIYGVGQYLANRLGRDIATLTFDELKSPEVKKITGEITFISATDGNHGRGIAWAARELGHKAMIYMPKGSSLNRFKAIESEGAIVEITEFNYDDSVRLAASNAAENGWVVVQDTAWDGYEEIPLWIMQGYATLAKEAVEQMKAFTEEPPTHVFLQAGVGSFAAGIAAFFIQYYQEKHPKIIVVEPHLANCYYQSFASNDESFQVVGGEMNTIMAGLACGEPNKRAWQILRHYAEVAFTCDDQISALGMRILGNPLAEDSPITSGESGAVTTGLLYCLAKEAWLNSAKQHLDLNQHSRILLINTEGDTDTEHYRKIVWEGKYPYSKN
ncbi:diaminopropionate ammonia-lyase [Peribacillus tepidiphilus]|uniref:diaminopropionate ammonia-lyase n=1 Tax=Peribacillus tepidiphilus TaxID=2652445 RepID=UPI001CDCA95C|nr:diaminopropionate ammonia-lyase [Peribacillus tepidiphilus]